MRIILFIALFFSLQSQGQIINASPNYRPFAASGYCGDTDADAFITATGITSTTDKDAICALVKALKDSSVWSLIDVIYPFIGSTATTQKYNLKNPATFEITFNGSWTHSSSGADPGTTSSDYGNTGYTPSSSGSMTTSSNHISIDIEEDNSGSGSDPFDIGSYISGTQNILFSSKAGGNVKYANLAGIVQVANTNAIGFWVISHTSSSNVAAYKDNFNYSNTSSNSGTLPSSPVFIGNTSISGSAYSNGAAGRKMDFITMGAALSTTEARALYNILQTYKTAIGR